MSGGESRLLGRWGEALAAEELRAKYPERKLVVIDSLCSSSGYGLLVDSAGLARWT